MKILRFIAVDISLNLFSLTRQTDCPLVQLNQIPSTQTIFFRVACPIPSHSDLLRRTRRGEFIADPFIVAGELILKSKTSKRS